MSMLCKGVYCAIVRKAGRCFSKARLLRLAWFKLVADSFWWRKHAKTATTTLWQRKNSRRYEDETMWNLTAASRFLYVRLVSGALSRAATSEDA